MWWWRKVRKAQISKEDRDLFERFGEAVIGSVLANRTSPTAPELQSINAGSGKVKEARDWLTECRDAHERREQRLEFVEWAIFIFILIEIVLSVASLGHVRYKGIIRGAITGSIVPRAQAALLDKKDSGTLASTSSAAQKPAPQPTEQQKLKEHVDALDSQLREAQAKADRALMEKDYIERIQKEAKDYYDKVLSTQTWTLGIVGLIITIVSAATARFGLTIFDRHIDQAVSKATSDLETKFDKKLADELRTLKESNAAQMKQLEDDLKLRSDWQFQFLQGIASVANKEYIDALHSFRRAVEYYKLGKRRQLLETRAGEISIANLFQIFSMSTANKNDRDSHAREELKSQLFDGLEEELAQASLREEWLAPLVRERKPGPDKAIT